MFKVYKDENLKLFNFSHIHSLIIDLEPNEFQYVSNIHDADIIVILDRYNGYLEDIQFLKNNFCENKIVLRLSLFHIESWHSLFHEKNDPCRLAWDSAIPLNFLVHTNLAAKDDGIYYDFLWERQKIYFQHYDEYDLSDRLWTFSSSKKMFHLDTIKTENNLKHFLSPMRFANRGLRDTYRSKLANFLDDSKGIMSSSDYILDSQEITSDIAVKLKSGGTWFPINNRYYNQTITSIYVETLVNGTFRSITEKTWDPLIKGHFILPFGYKGLINDIKDYGFILPDFIDYSYDNLPDKQRWKYYLKSVKDYLNKDINELTELRNKNLDILEYNRNLFFVATKQSLSSKLKQQLRIREVVNSPGS